MTCSSLIGLNDRSLVRLRDALKGGLLQVPIQNLTLSQLVPQDRVTAVAKDLQQLEAIGMTAPLLLALVESLIEQRRQLASESDNVELVVTGPEPQGSLTRDTAVVVRQLFGNAKESVLVVGYAIYQGRKVFESLAKRMEQIPELNVQLFLNVTRDKHDRSDTKSVVSQFVKIFKDSQWPENCRLPEVYYDPRSVSPESPVRSSLHAKCVVVDGRQVFVSSANFTEAGQERNIEVGLSIHSPRIATELTRHFRLLHEHGLAARAI